MRAISSSDLAKLAEGITSPVSLCWKTVMGTPQARWREITQSGLDSTMPRSRLRPEAGTNSVSSMAPRATSRSVRLPATLPSSGLSMAMNHWGVLRKITGFLERQECGYWCLRRPRAISVSASTSALMTASLASPLLPLSSMTRLPSNPGASLVKRPSASTVKGMAVSMPRAFSRAAFSIQMSKSSRPWPGAVCTKPVPSSSVTWSPARRGTSNV